VKLKNKINFNGAANRKCHKFHFYDFSFLPQSKHKVECTSLAKATQVVTLNVKRKQNMHWLLYDIFNGASISNFVFTPKKKKSSPSTRGGSSSNVRRGEGREKVVCREQPPLIVQHNL